MLDRYRYILLLLFSVTIPASDIYTDSWALVIGINSYENHRDLNYAVEDALSIKNLLINDFNFPRDNVTVLTNSDATQYNIKKELHHIVKNASEGDRVVFYFAGHGETESLELDETSMGFLVPSDGDPENLYLTSIPMGDLKTISKWSKAKHMLFLVDACYGGLAALNTRGGLQTSTPGYIDKVAEDVSRQVLTAGDKDEVVLESDEWEHSAFTKNILAGLKEGKADTNADGVVTGAELGEYVKEKVAFDTKNAQTPQNRKFTTDDGEIIFSISDARDDDVSVNEDDLQAMIDKMFMEKLQQANTAPQKSTETVILPGSKGFYITSGKEFLVSDIFYSPDGLSYRGKLKLSIGMDDDSSWSPTVCVLVKDVLVVDGSSVGQYSYSTGTYR